MTKLHDKSLHDGDNQWDFRIAEMIKVDIKRNQSDDRLCDEIMIYVIGRFRHVVNK